MPVSVREKIKIGKAALLMCMVAFSFSSCAMIESRPVKQIAYAEAAMQGAILANAEANPETVAVFQLARDSLARARSFYRLKNFREARSLAVRARRLAEEAEWRSLRGNSAVKEDDSLMK